MKKLLLALTLTACNVNTNGAQLMVESQVPKAECSSATIKGIDVTVCDVPGKDKIVQVVGAYQKGKLPFQAFPLSDGTEKKDAAPAAPTAPTAPTAPPAPGQGSGAAAPTPDAGSASK